MVHALSRPRPLKTTPNSILAAALAGLLLALPALAAGLDFTGPVVAGQAAEPANRESSGLATSIRTPGLLWTHNDSGGEPVLFAFNADGGAARGRVRLAGVKNYDWEDLASFERDGRAWLLVADTGDNFARRKSAVLYVLEEPDSVQLKPGTDLVLPPAYSISYVYEDGARDCEAVAVDPREGMIYLLTKRDVPARLYRLPLQPATADQPAVARKVGEVPHLPQPDAGQRLVQMPRYALLGMPTAMDFSPDGTFAAVVLYSNVFIFPRGSAEFWPAALAKTPIALADHQLPQAEAVSVSRDGRHLFVTSEKTGQVLRYDRR